MEKSKTKCEITFLFFLSYITIIKKFSSMQELYKQMTIQELLSARRQQVLGMVKKNLENSVDMGAWQALVIGSQRVGYDWNNLAGIQPADSLRACRTWSWNLNSFLSDPRSMFFTTNHAVILIMQCFDSQSFPSYFHVINALNNSSIS